jgi:hydrogenase maturation factor
MSNELRDQRHLSKYELIPITGAQCELDAEGHCITCSDEALQARVLRVDQEAGLAVVTIQDTSEEIDITLVESVAPGDVLLVHGGVAIARLDEVSNA